MTWDTTPLEQIERGRVHLRNGAHPPVQYGDSVREDEEPRQNDEGDAAHEADDGVDYKAVTPGSCKLLWAMVLLGAILAFIFAMYTAR